MSLSTLLDRIAGSNATPPAVDLNANQEGRRALLARAHREIAFPISDRPSVTRADEAQRFTSIMERRYRIRLKLDHESIDLLDAFIDAARTTRPDVLNGRFLKLAGSWLGECTRYNHSLRWTLGSILTDGRIAYDPYDAVTDRAESTTASNLLDSVRHAITMANIETMKAA